MFSLDHLSYSTPLLSFGLGDTQKRLCLIVKYCHTFIRLKCVWFWFRQGVITPVYNCLRQGIKPCFTQKYRQISAGRDLSVQIGTLKIVHWDIWWVNFAARFLKRRGICNRPWPGINFGDRGWLFLVTVDMMLAHL